jgi:hypothetical protein
MGGEAEVIRQLGATRAQRHRIDTVAFATCAIALRTIASFG